MKNAALLFLFLSLFKISFACSCSWGRTFCECHDDFSVAISGVVVDSFKYGISIKVLHLLNGNENRDTIEVWDLGGPYSMCNDSLSDSRSSFLGSVGDTLIIALPKIDTLKNSWDVIGDYRTPGFICDEHKLRVVNNRVFGLISGYSGSYCYYQNNCIHSYDYDDFINEFPTRKLDCQSWVGVQEKINTQSINIYPNPFTNQISIASEKTFDFQITDYLGKTILSGKTNEPITTDNLSKGNYLLVLKNEDAYSVKKITRLK
jgi:hypothetical protein